MIFERMEINVGKVVKNFKKYRFLLIELVKKDIKLKYRRSYLGILWTLIEPILTTAVLTMVFSTIYQKKDHIFPVYILTGRLLYSYFANSTKAAMKAIRGNSAMIKKVYVPKYIYPFSTILANYLTFLISLVVLFGAAMIFRVKPTIHLITAIIPLIQLLVLCLGTGLILATLAVFFRDLEYLWGVILMLIMYTSAIFYRIEIVNKENLWLYKLNPLYQIIVNFRNSIFGVPMDKEAMIYSTLYSIGALLIGTVMFYRKQDKFILNI